MGGMTAASFFAATAMCPVASQPSPPQNGTAAGDTLSATIPDETVAKAGAALKQVLEIKSVTSPRIEAAPAPDERVRFSKQVIDAAAKAIIDQGLTIDQYNTLMKMAQRDPDLRKRLLKATDLRP
jgi:hypothetical protein